MMCVIDLGQATDNGSVRNLAGKERGESARLMFNIDMLDAGLVSTDRTIEVRVPDFIYAISSSYLLGLFSPSVRKLGGPDQFFAHYKFSASASVIKQVTHAVNRSALRPQAGVDRRYS